MFKNPNDPNNTSIIKKVKEWLVAHYALDSEEGISVSEIPCNEINCPDMETMLSFPLSSGEIRSLRIRKPLVYIRKWDIDALIK